MMGRVRADELIADGYCTPQCLLALSAKHDRAVCMCRCGGRGHGLLAGVEVEYDIEAAPIGPPPMVAAAAMSCQLCGKVIGRKQEHILARAEQGNVVLSYCCLRNNSRKLHHQLWPSCPKRDWHDFYDHPHHYGTRAGIAALLPWDGAA